MIDSSSPSEFQEGHHIASHEIDCGFVKTSANSQSTNPIVALFTEASDVQ